MCAAVVGGMVRSRLAEPDECGLVHVDDLLFCVGGKVLTVEHLGVCCCVIVTVVRHLHFAVVHTFV